MRRCRRFIDRHKSLVLKAMQTSFDRFSIVSENQSIALRARLLTQAVKQNLCLGVRLDALRRRHSEHGRDTRASYLIRFTEKLRARSVQTQFNGMMVQEFIRRERHTLHFVVGRTFFLRTQLLAHQQALFVLVIQVAHRHSIGERQSILCGTRSPSLCLPDSIRRIQFTGFECVTTTRMTMRMSVGWIDVCVLTERDTWLN